MTIRFERRQKRLDGSDSVKKRRIYKHRSGDMDHNNGYHLPLGTMHMRMHLRTLQLLLPKSRSTYRVKRTANQAITALRAFRNAFRHHARVRAFSVCAKGEENSMTAPTMLRTVAA